MTTGETLLADIIGRGGQLDTEGERLRLRGPRDDAIRDAVREHRDDLIRLLAGRRAIGLTGIQRRLWFLQQLDASGVGYTFSYVHRITGPVDPERFGSALGEVVAAHPALRAGFVELAGGPVQLIAPDVLPHTEVLADSAELKDFLVRPFDLGKPPLLRSALVQTESGSWLWGLTLHHLIADGWTYALIVRQLSEVLSGQMLEPIAADYGDFVAYEHRHDASRQSAVDHWAGLLADLPNAELPHSHPRPPLRTYAGRQLDSTLPASVTDRLSKLAAQEGTTLFAVLLAVHAAVLAKHTGSDRVVVGTPYANRPEARFHDTAGCFVSTLVLPVDLTGEPTFRQLTARAGQVCTTAWDHAEFPYEQLVERLAPQRDTSRNALFQSFFAVQDIPVRLRVPGAHTSPKEFDTGITQFDIETYLTPGENGDTTLTFRYNSDLFAPAEMADLTARWRLLAERLSTEPDRGVHEISLLSAEERALITATNRTTMPYPRDKRADELFAAVATAFPDRLALVCGARRLTYGELDALVAEMAETLHAAGGRGQRIGIQLPRSPEMVAAVLATMRAGATYVPLAPDAPADRLARLSEGAGLRFTWTVDGLHARTCPEGPLRDVQCPEGVLQGIGQARGAAAAYVLHTSGSTGVPKGVQVGHQALVNLLTSMGEHPGLAADDVLVAVTGLTFDIAMLELLLPLIRGATLVVATDEQARDPRLLAELLDTAGATVVQMTPSGARMLLDTGWQGTGLRVWCGGEPLSRDLADELLSTCDEVWNLYGPTETTVWSARWRVEQDGPVRIGEPVGNTGLHVLDRHGTVLPPSIPGELHISGDGLADGYLDRPEETAARFVTITTENGAAVPAYRTGDLVQRLRDGTLVCLGRTDDQLKVRGHRVEPEEIEHAMRTHPGVRDAVVVLTAAGQLVAHLLVGSDSPTEQSLRAHLSGQLPPAIIPERFVVHAELPRTSNGKIDRRALRDAEVPESGGPVTEPPQSADEHLVADVYREFLTAQSVGRLDDFFSLGGNSLVATRVLHRLETTAGVRIPLHAFMRDATVAAVATQLTQNRLSEDQDTALHRALALLDAMSETEVAAIAYGPDSAKESR